MATYIEISNKSKILINDEWHNFSLIDIHTITANNGIVKFSCAPNELVFAQVQDANVEFNMSRDLSNLEMTLLINRRPATGVAVRIYRFSQQSTSQNAPLRIFNGRGVEIFNSNLKYMNVIDNRVYPGGKTYPYDIAVYCPYNYEVDASGHVWYRSWYMMTNRFVKVTDSYKVQYLDSLKTFGIAPEMIIDVSNL